MSEQIEFKRNRVQKSTENFKIVVIVVTMGSVCALTHYFHIVLKTCSVFTQLYYIPIVFAAIWWKRKGLFVPIFLGGFNIIDHMLVRTGILAADFLRALVFLTVGLVVTILSEQIAKAERTMAAERKKLRSLAHLLSTTEERQRRDIAAGLHDSVGPKLSAAKILVQTMKSKGPKDTSGRLDKVIDWLQSSIKEIRGLIFELSPKMLYEIGLKSAVESLIESFEQESSIKFHYMYVGPTNILDHKIRSIIFRAIRELFTNIGKYAQAQNVYVKIEIDSERLNVIIEDDGVGFDISGYSKGTETDNGFGLFSIRQQLLDLDGQIIVESEVGSGTKVTITCPIETAEKLMQEVS